MKYLITSRKPVTLDGVLRAPGDLVEEPSNARQLVRRGLAVPFPGVSEQAAAFSPSSGPAQLPSKVVAEGETESKAGDGAADSSSTADSGVPDTTTTGGADGSSASAPPAAVAAKPVTSKPVKK
jgi:hypothetical protein